jgi:hypothetical protein
MAYSPRPVCTIVPLTVCSLVKGASVVVPFSQTQAKAGELPVMAYPSEMT